MSHLLAASFTGSGCFRRFCLNSIWPSSTSSWSSFNTFVRTRIQVNSFQQSSKNARGRERRGRGRERGKGRREEREGREREKRGREKREREREEREGEEREREREKTGKGKKRGR